MKKLIFMVLICMTCLSIFALSMEDFQLASVAGSRKEPLKAKEGYIVAETYTSQLRIGFSGCIRGELANAIVVSSSMFNSAPEDGKEYALVYFYVQNDKDLTGNDEPCTISSYSFDVADEKYKKRDNFEIVIDLPDMIDVELYEEISHEGFVICQVDIGKPFYLVFNNKYWFYIPAESSELTDL